MNYSIMCLIVIALALSGCSSTDIRLGGFESKIEWNNWQMSTEDKLWQAGHLVDVLQTETYHREDCYVEADPITRRTIGREPSTEKVIAWGVAHSAINHYYFQFVDNSNMPRWLKKTMTWTNILVKYDVIYDNHQMGVRIGKPAKKQPESNSHCDWR